MLLVVAEEDRNQASEGEMSLLQATLADPRQIQNLLVSYSRVYHIIICYSIVWYVMTMDPFFEQEVFGSVTEMNPVNHFVAVLYSSLGHCASRLLETYAWSMEPTAVPRAQSLN